MGGGVPGLQPQLRGGKLGGTHGHPHIRPACFGHSPTPPPHSQPRTAQFDITVPATDVIEQYSNSERLNSLSLPELQHHFSHLRHQTFKRLGEQQNPSAGGAATAGVQQAQPGGLAGGLKLAPASAGSSTPVVPARVSVWLVRFVFCVCCRLYQFAMHVRNRLQI